MTKTRVPGVAADGRGLSARSILATLRRSSGSPQRTFKPTYGSVEIWSCPGFVDTYPVGKAPRRR